MIGNGHEPVGGEEQGRPEAGIGLEGATKWGKLSRFLSGSVWLHVGLIVVLGVAAFCNTFSIPFSEEDERIFVGNEAVHHVSRIQEAVSPDMPRPLGLLSLAANWELTPDSRVGFRGVGVMLHVFTAVLVYFLSRRVFLGKLPEPIAMLAGLLWALHPGMTESVNLVGMRGGQLGVLFIVLGVLLYLRSWEGEDLRPGPMCFSYAAFACAWGANERAVLFPLLVLAADWVVLGAPGWGRRFPFLLGHWVFLMVMIVSYQLGSAPEWHEWARVREPSGISAEAEAVLSHVKMALTGGGLSIVHGEPSGSVLWVLAACGLFVLALGLLVVRSPLGLGLFWLAAGAVHVPMLVTMEPLVCDRRLYLALVGASLIVPWGFGAVLRTTSTRLVGAVGVVALLAVSSVGTFMRNGVWGDELALWTAAGEVAGESSLVERNVGRIYLEQGEALLREVEEKGVDIDSTSLTNLENAAREEFLTSESHLREADRLEPGVPETLYLLGRTLRALDRKEEALGLYLRALREDPMHVECTLAAGALLEERAIKSLTVNDLRHALAYYDRAAELKPLTKEYSARRGMLLAQLGDYREAREALMKALAEDGGGGSPLQDPAPYRLRLEQVEAAISRLDPLEEQMIALERADPDSAAARAARSRVLCLRKEFQQAFYVIEQLLGEKGSEDVETWVSMGFVKAIMGECEEFLTEWPNPFVEPERRRSAWFELAKRCAELEQWDRALEYLQMEAAQADVPFALLTMADVASALSDAARAEGYLRQAADSRPADPQPWLRLFDLALDQKKHTAAQGYLAEAKGRGADAGEVAACERRLQEMRNQGEDAAVVVW